MTGKWYSAVFLGQCLVQPPTEKFPSASNGNRYRDPEKDNVQRMRNCETLSPNWGITIKSLPSELRKLDGRGGKNTCQSEWRPLRKTKSFNSTWVSSYELRLKQHAKDLHRHASGRLWLNYGSQMSVFTGLLRVWECGSLTLCPLLCPFPLVGLTSMW